MKRKPAKKAPPPAKERLRRKAKEKRKRGRPEGTGFKPTDEQRKTVEFMAACGIPEDQMVIIIENPKSKKPISPMTLRRHFRLELDRGMLDANIKVVGGMFKNATTGTPQNPHGNPILQMFWTKTRMGWRDRAALGLELPPDAPSEAGDDQPSSMYEFARRIAFVLHAAAAAGVKAAEPKTPIKKKQAA